ncbi:MAG: hypothetical protein NTV63_03245, partial [Candidatus Woesearchaeota archaeon]|nr:hypothetical protein [Candidatus Woesearchaeota archaeon]
MEEKDNLEAICDFYFGKDKEKMYSLLKDFIFLKIPVEPDKPYQIACDATILKNYLGSSAIKYKMAGFVALLNADYSMAEQHLHEYVEKAGLNEGEASKYATILSNKEKVHDVLQEYFKPQ